LIRINPKPVIEFHKAAFLGSRDLSESDFLAKVLDSMFFTMFVTERGPPWRRYDAFDELYSAMPELLKSENNDRRYVVTHIQELAQKLYVNEIPNSQNYQQKIPRPPDGALSRIHQPEFPTINAQQVQKIISEGMAKNDLQSRFQLKTNLKIIPLGPQLPSVHFNEGRPILTHTVRKMEVIQNCVNFVFENKIAEARKIFPAVLRILKQRDEARLFLCEELAKVVQNSNKVLEHPQFDLVIKLMNRALQDNSQNNLHDVAASLLPLSAAFCRKLCPGVIQFAYSCIQGHGIWKNQSFWEQAFYQEIQANIKNLYVNRPIERNNWSGTQSIMNSPYDLRMLTEQSALEIAAEQMMKWPTMDPERQQNFTKSEEQIVYSQAVHYANRMIFLLIPMDVRSNVKVKKTNVRQDEDDASISNSVLESRSDQSTDVFEVRDANEVEQTVIRQVEKFIDKVCNEGGVTPENIKKLHEIIPSMVDMHCETLDIVYRESKRIPPVQKPKIQSPNLLSGEIIIFKDPIRAILLPDGREETLSPLLPAEGAIFLTNYRCIFKGLPCDSLTCEQNVIRAFPVASLTKEKRISGILSNEHVFADGLQLRSSTFQLMKLAFDEDVTQEAIENFRKLLNRVRHPEDEYGHFAFSNYSISKPQNQKSKEKYATIKGFAKKTLLKTGMKSGFKGKNHTKRKYIFSTPNEVDNFYGGSMAGGMNNNMNNENSDDDDNSDEMNVEPTPSRFTVKDVERLKERNYVKDFQRLGLLGSGFRLTTVNCNYGLCRTYPALFVSPRTINDDQLKSLAKTFKSQRIPIPTWRHSNGSCLLRGSVSLAKGVMGMLKTGSTHTSSESKSDGMLIQDQYFCTFIPQHLQQNFHNFKVKNSESSVSIDSLLGPRSPMAPSFSTLNRKDRNFLKPGKWDSLKRNNEGLREAANHYEDHMTLQRNRVPMYVLGERSQSKSVRLAEFGVEYIPVYYPDSRNLREAFKKLMRACLPSNISNEPDNTFFKLIENSEWLQQIRNLLQLSGTIVDLIEIHEANVQIALEDGWDFSCQVSALAQLCLDPYYR
jgi:myotubularin-related protein 5/13